MSLRDLVEADCGGPSPLIRLTSHFVKDHGLKEEGVRELFGSLGPYEAGNSDQLVKQFLEETQAHPNTFKMDNLLQEMRDIDHSVHPPVTAPGVAQELTSQDTAWANQYLQSGGHFQETHSDDIWNAHPVANANVAFPGETGELGLGPKWAEEYLEQRIEPDGKESSDFAYSKFMKFMRQEGDLPLESAAVAGVEESFEKWTSEFTETENTTKPAEQTDETPKQDDSNVLSAVDEQNAVAGNWIDEFTNNDNQELAPIGNLTSGCQKDKSIR